MCGANSAVEPAVGPRLAGKAGAARPGEEPFELAAQGVGVAFVGADAGGLSDRVVHAGAEARPFEK